MTAHAGEIRVCIDRRTVAGQDSGVSIYGETLRRTLIEAGVAVATLHEGEQAPHSRWRRWAAARMPGARRLHATATGYTRRDIFREAQVRFRKFGTITPLVAPGPPGVMHWTYPLPMRIRGWRNLYTVHDVIPLAADMATPVDGARLARLLHALATEADGFVTVSDAARREIVALPGMESVRVTNLSQAIDVAAAAEGPLPAGLVPGDYLLFAGAAEVRKNLPRLIAAYRRADTARPLALVGPPGGDSAAVAAAIGGDARIRHLGYRPRATVLALIRDARALLLPSLAEGFGLPVAEAMALGTPVLTADRGALAEVAGGAALLVDPLAETAIAAGIARLDRDDTLCASLAAAGRARAVAFERASYARRLTGLYGDIMHG